MKERNAEKCITWGLGGIKEGKQLSTAGQASFSWGMCPYNCFESWSTWPETLFFALASSWPMAWRQTVSTGPSARRRAAWAVVMSLPRVAELPAAPAPRMR